MSRVIIEDRVLIDKENNDLIGRHSEVVRTRATVHTKPNSVTVSYSQYRMGRNKHSDKLWGRWQSNGLSSIYRTSTGKIAFLARSDKNRPHGGAVAMNAVAAAMAHPEFAAAVEEFGVRGYSDVYPALGIFADAGDRVNFRDLSGIVTSAYEQQPVGPFSPKTRRRFDMLHTDDPRGLISLATGLPYRKDIARAIREKSISQFGLLRFAKAMDPSWAADFITSLDKSETTWGNNWIGRALDLYKRDFISKDTYRKMTIEGRKDVSLSIVPLYAADAFRMAGQVLTARESRRMFKENSLVEIHDILTEMVNAKTDERLSRPIEYSEHMQEIDGMQVGEYTISLAKTASEVKNWGRVQNHCIGSYAEESYTGRYIHAAVMEGDKMVANFQLSGRRLSPWDDKASVVMSQIYGYGNSLFAGAEEVHKHLVEKGYIGDTPVAGIPGRMSNIIADGVIRGNRIQANDINAGRIAAERQRI